jgi:hypothetical protein
MNKANVFLCSHAYSADERNFDEYVSWTIVGIYFYTAFSFPKVNHVSVDFFLEQ